jgi:hypothetical protein
MMDNPATARGRGASCTPAIRSMPPRILLCELDGTARRSHEQSRRVFALLRDAARTEVRVAATSASAALLGRAQGGVPRGRPAVAGLLLHGRHHSARSVWATCCDRDGRDCRSNTGCGGERVPCRRRQPASADPVRRTQPGELQRAEAFGARILESSASRSAAPSPASMAWVSKRSTRCACSSRRPNWRSSTRVKAAFDPAGLLNPGKAVPTLRAARSSGACTCTMANSRTPSWSASEHDDRRRLQPARSRCVAAACGHAPRCDPRRRHASDFWSCGGRYATRHGRAPRRRCVRTRGAGADRARRHAARRDRSALLAEHRQMLAFEPPRFGAASTLGGAIAAAMSGPRRPYAGAPRDFVLGVRCVNGRGELLRLRRAGDEERGRLRCVAPDVPVPSARWACCWIFR